MTDSIDSTLPSPEFFAASDWQSLYSADANRSEISGALEEAVAGAEPNAYTTALLLLVRVSRVMLDPHDWNAPHKPWIQLQDSRSFRPSDLEPTEFQFLDSLVPSIKSDSLRAIVADQLWHVMSPREIRLAITAVESYLKMPLLAAEWYKNDGSSCWIRALQILSRINHPRLKASRTYAAKEMVDAIQRACDELDLFAVVLSDVFYEYNLAPEYNGDIANRLFEICQDTFERGEMEKCARFCRCTAKWLDRQQEREMSNDTKALLADALVALSDEARGCALSGAGMVAASKLDEAGEVYKGLPKKYRARFEIDEEMARIKLLATNLRFDSLDEMAIIRSEPVDITDYAKQARELVAGLDRHAALHQFISLTGRDNFDEQFANARQELNENVLTRLFDGQTLAEDGRITAITSRSLYATAPSNAEVESHMVRSMVITGGLTAQALLVPALHQILTEHSITLEDILCITQNNPVIPPAQATIWARGIHAGFRSDFLTATMLLSPMLESAIRRQLRALGISTTVVQNGIESERGLTSLIQAEELKKVFGPLFLLQVRSLFTDAVGANLRHNVAHGIIDDRSSGDVHCLTAWYLLFRLVFLHHLASQ